MDPTLTGVSWVSEHAIGSLTFEKMILKLSEPSLFHRNSQVNKVVRCWSPHFSPALRGAVIVLDCVWRA